MRSLAALEQDVRFQPGSFRLESMGGLGLAVRDEYNELNLWDFAGLPLGLAADRDSTSLDLWLDSGGRTFDRRFGSIEQETERRRDTQLAGETVVRSGALAVGADFGTFSFRRGAPFGDRTHLTRNGSQPAFVPMASGHLVGALRWGLRGLVARERFHEQVWSDVQKGDRIGVGSTGDRLEAPNLFFPEDTKADALGLGASLGYARGSQVESGVYFDYRHEKLETDLETVRSIYNADEPRDVLGYGAAVIVRPRAHVEVGGAVGREWYASKENYRFTLSGGSVDPPFSGRGEKALHGDRRDFVRLRGQADLPHTPVTVGAAFRVSYDRAQQQAIEGRPSDFNDFIQTRVAGDTIQAPPIVENQLAETRSIEFGGGASVRALESRATVGAEYRRFRDARSGDLLLARATGWEARAGGELAVTRRWTARVGYRHHFEDQDSETPRNELVADRASVGLAYEGLFHFTVEAYGYREWWRSDYPDPEELGGPGSGLGLFLRRLF